MSKELEQEVFEDLSKILLKLQNIPDPIVVNIGQNGYGNWEPRVVSSTSKESYNSNLNYDEHGYEEYENKKSNLVKDEDKLYDYVSNAYKTNSEIFNKEFNSLSSLKGILTQLLENQKFSEWVNNDMLAKFYNSKC